jgi:cellulose synthase/poly-beta-1,6-N-acetylglucosamine synthase-like glycosyltransferase
MMLFTLFQIIDLVIFVYIAFCVLYIVLFAIASLFYHDRNYTESEEHKRILVLFPAYKEDSVIESAVKDFLFQDYPKDKYLVVVISDKMKDETNERLSELPIKLLKVNFENSTKAKAMNFAIDSMASERFDIIAILDADNLADRSFLKKINDAYMSGIMALQMHRKAKNIQNDVAVFDAISEEVNNAIFRKGHNVLGLSSALIGSGMAFDYCWFSDNVKRLHTAGEDKELETLLLEQSIMVYYMDSVCVSDEKTSKNEVYSRQRQRWLSAQFNSFICNISKIPFAIRKHNFDLLNKILQWMLLPRVLMFGISFIISVSLLVLIPSLSIKWLIVTALQIFVFILCTPKKLSVRFIKSSWKTLPSIFILMFMNLFKLRGSNSFIHTPHGKS